MPRPNRKGIFIVLLAMFLVVGVAVIPDIISEEMRAWCLSTFGEGYQGYLLGFFVAGSVVLLFLTTDIGKWLRPGASPSKPDRFNIPPGAATRRQINLAREAIGKAESEQALQHLSELKSEALANAVIALNGRYAEYRRNSRFGLLSTKEETLISNQIKHDILDLVKVLEQELATGIENYQIIKDYLKKRYSNRLGQKLAKRQPVNLRRIPSTEGTTEERAATFIPYNSDEAAGTMAQNFRDARGRLLLIGAPGAGKTTLMLQLVLDLLDSEPDALPVLLNLATWSSEYITLEAWLKKILLAELGVSDIYAAEIMQQGRLILLLDGFDEIRQDDRATCLEAIGRYGEDAGRQFVISSRIEEYKTVAKDAPVYCQIEVGPLSINQLEAELNRLWEQEKQPESRALLQAIQKDALLRQAAETPFYFNTLQILFSGGKILADLRFSGETIEARQSEILERFIEYELKAPARQEYPPEQIKHWLSFLASRMTERNMVVFELQDLQYNWWNWSSWVLKLGGIVKCQVVGVTVGIIICIFVCPIVVIPNGLEWGLNRALNVLAQTIFSIFFSVMIFGFFIGLFTNKKSSSVISVNTINVIWSFNSLPKSAKNDILKSWVFGITLFFIIFFKVPIFWLLFGVGVWTLTILFKMILYLIFNNVKIIQINTPYQRFIASTWSLYFTILPHLLIRYQLCEKGLLPFRLVDFLNEMSTRHILEFDGDPLTGKGGGAWRFRHRILQEWFAERWVEPDWPDEKNTDPINKPPADVE